MMDCNRVHSYSDFLDRYFAGYLSNPNNKNSICGVSLNGSHNMTDARGDIVIGRKNEKGKGGRIRRAFLERIEKERGGNGYSEIIRKIETRNRELLTKWNLDVIEVKGKLINFISQMREGSTDEGDLIAMPTELRHDVLGRIQEQVEAGTTLESMAVPITWLLLTALLRGEVQYLKEDYLHMGEYIASDEKMNPLDKTEKEKHIPVREPKYTHPEEIRPFTMENVGNMRNTYVKRNQLLMQIDRKMHGGSGNSKKIVFISAMGGEGKTELARAYAYTFRGEYDEIFWFICEKEEMQGIENILENSIYSHTVTPDIVNDLNERCLLILDNCNRVSTVALKQLMTKTGKAHILITTRLAVITQLSPDHMLYLKSSEKEKSNFACQIFTANYLAEPHDFWYMGSEEEDCEGEVPGDYIYPEISAKEIDEKTSENRMIQFSEEEQSDIRIICNRICNHPMTAAIVAVMLRENKDSESIRKFADKCRKGLQYAFPSYEIPFGQGENDYEEKPETILKALFTSFPKREFTEAEKKLLTVLQMVPAKQLNMQFITELLRDQEQNKEIRNACRSLCSLNWLQSNGVWITMHPLLAQVLEWDHNRIQLEEEQEKFFYREVMENWMLSITLDEEETEYGSYLGYRIWKKSGIMEEKSGLDLALRLLIHKSQAREYLESMMPELSCALTAMVYGENQLSFLCYDLLKKEEEIIYSLKKKRMQKKQKEAKLLFLICKEKQMDLQFPDTLAGKPILEIPDSFCKMNIHITSLKFPENLKGIGENAFYKCGNLSGGLELPESLEKLGNSAFCECNKLSGNLTIHGNLREIGAWAFCECGMNGELVIEEGVREIKESAFSNAGFSGCVKFPKSLERIGKGAFRACKGLIDIEMQEGLRFIEA